jgi:hypothetical protein
MRYAACLLAVFVSVVSGQTSGDSSSIRDSIARRLHTDLTNLKALPVDVSIPTLSQQCLGKRTTPRPPDCAQFDRVSDDFALATGRPQHFPTQTVAFNLVRVLVGHELDPDALWLLTSSLVDGVALADQSAAARTPASNSRAFRESAFRAYVSLLALGIEKRRAENFVGIFLNFADSASRHKAELIPPGLVN